MGWVTPAMQVSREQFRRLFHHQRHGFTAAGIAIGINPVCIDVVIIQKVARQDYGLVC